MDEPLLVTRILIFVLINQLLTEHFTDGDIIATVQNEEEDKMLVIRNMIKAIISLNVALNNIQ